MKHVTAGERLFFLLKEDILPSVGQGHVTWSNLSNLFEYLGGSVYFSDYVKGAIAVHTIRRLLRFWSSERIVTNEIHFVKRLSDFIKEEIFPGLDTHSVAKLARAVIAAEDASGRDIGTGIRSRILRRGQATLTCYLCGRDLNVRADQTDADYPTLEHLWPSSLGGDSVEGNLLPACKDCQHTTKDTASWEWLNVQNLVLPPAPSRSALASVSKPARFARHYLEALRMCDEKRISLKEAFLILGPISATITHINTGQPITFFDLITA